MIGLLGKKVGMTTIFTDDGRRVPVTVLEAGPCKVVQVKSPENDGYAAIQLGYEPIKPKKANKPLLGHFKKAGTEPFRKLKEFTVEDVSEKFEIGQEIKASDIFKEGELVDCTGVSKGKGFQGVVRRHKFGGGPKTHGQADKFRAPGSIGASSFPSRVVKGIRMAGHMGNRTVTVRGLKIMKILKDDNIILVKGTIAGPKGGYVVIRRSKKKAK
ncbi:50S ribosomal protein L3 [bacterium]|nr:MAG: 50S ribosomal protein L3 [bacterium]